MPTTAPASTVEINGYAMRWGRKLMNLTPAALADAIERDRSYIVKIETGAVTRISTDTFERLVKALQLEDARALRALPHVVDPAA